MHFFYPRFGKYSKKSEKSSQENFNVNILSSYDSNSSVFCLSCKWTLVVLLQLNKTLKAFKFCISPFSLTIRK